MRVILFLTWDVSLEVWRQKGLLQRELKLYDQLVAKGIEVTLITWRGEQDNLIAESFPQFTVFPVYTRLPWFESKIMRAMLSPFVPFFIGDVVTRNTVFKTNQMWGAWVAVIAKWLYRKPLIVRSGFELYDFTLKGAYGPVRKIFIRWISRLAYNNADRIFVATESDKTFVQKHFGIEDDLFEICPNWIDTDLFSPDAATPRHGRILFVGRMNAQKNLPALIQAAHKAGVGLDIVGIGELEESLKIMARDLKSDVTFTGAISNSELTGLYRACAFFVLPSFYEGNPKALLEAMACGTAVLGCDVDGVRDVIAHGENGYLCGTDEKSLETAILYLKDAPEMRKAMGNKAREAVLANNTLAAQVAREVKSVRKLTGIL